MTPAEVGEASRLLNDLKLLENARSITLRGAIALRASGLRRDAEQDIPLTKDVGLEILDTLMKSKRDRLTELGVEMVFTEEDMMLHK